jgi:hypothetical protein
MSKENFARRYHDFTNSQNLRSKLCMKRNKHNCTKQVALLLKIHQHDLLSTGSSEKYTKEEDKKEGKKSHRSYPMTNRKQLRINGVRILGKQRYNSENRTR